MNARKLFLEEFIAQTLPAAQGLQESKPSGGNFSYPCLHINAQQIPPDSSPLPESSPIPDSEPVPVPVEDPPHIKPDRQKAVYRVATVNCMEIFRETIQ